MKSFQFGGEDHQRADRELALHRGLAINAYAGVEHNLCTIMAHCGDIPVRAAGTIFFKITNSRSRNEIVDKLKKDKYGAANNLFWNSLLKEIQKVDKKRNQIVLWHSRLVLGG